MRYTRDKTLTTTHTHQWSIQAKLAGWLAGLNGAFRSRQSTRIERERSWSFLACVEVNSGNMTWSLAGAFCGGCI